MILYVLSHRASSGIDGVFSSPDLAWEHARSIERAFPKMKDGGRNGWTVEKWTLDNPAKTS